MGYVHHARYLEYFEMGRTEYMRSAGHSYADVEEAGHFLVLAEAHLTYRRPATYDMEVTIRTRVKEITHTQVTFEYILENGEEILCEGRTRLACTDKDGKLRRIPERIRRALKGE
jgi:acyl-CoA thioester hydrolase